MLARRANDAGPPTLVAWLACADPASPTLVVYDTGSGREVAGRPLPMCDVVAGCHLGLDQVVGEHVYLTRTEYGEVETGGLSQRGTTSRAARHARCARTRALGGFGEVDQVLSTRMIGVVHRGAHCHRPEPGTTRPDSYASTTAWALSRTPSLANIRLT